MGSAILQQNQGKFLQKSPIILNVLIHDEFKITKNPSTFSCGLETTLITRPLWAFSHIKQSAVIVEHQVDDIVFLSVAQNLP